METIYTLKTAFRKLRHMPIVLLLLLFGLLQSQNAVAQNYGTIFSSSMSSSTYCQLILNGTNATFVDAGWIWSNGTHSSGNSNYYTGIYGSEALRSFFAFTWTGGTITSATFRVYTYDIYNYTTSLTLHIKAIPDYSYATLDADRGSGDATGTAMFNAIGAAADIGSLTGITSGNAQNYINITISDLVALNAMGSNIRIGAKCDGYSSYTAPVFTASAASSVLATSATFNGSVTPNGNSGNYYFEYGTTGSYGSTTTSRAYSSSSASLSENVSSLSAGTTYYYRLHGTVSGQSDVYSSQMSFSTPPANPTSISASASTICNGSGTTLTASGNDGTVYWYSGSCGGTYINTGNSITVYPTTTTNYYARNYKNAQYSAGCATTTITVNNPATMPASAVINSVTQNTASLSWGSSSGTATISYYWVVGTSASVTYGSGTAQGTTDVSNTSATATGLSPSTNYYMRVFANSTAAPCGASAYRTSSMFTTVPLAPVANSQTNVRANSFTANWAASTGATSYYLDISTDNFSTYLSGYQNKSVGNVLTYSLSGLNRATTYYYRVRAYNAGGSSVNSNTISFATLPLNNFLLEIAGGGDISVQLAGQPFSIKITARDASNTTVTDFTGIVTITTNSTLTSGGTTSAFTAGILSSNSVTLTMAGELKTLTATSGSVVSTSNTFTVTPADINHWTLSVDGGGTVTAGTTFTVTATVYDQFGNIKTNYSGSNSVNWTTTATSSANGTARILPINGNQSFTNGVSAGITGFTFFNSDQSQLSPFTKPTITITDGPSAVAGTTAPITVLNAPLDNFKVVAGTSQAGGVPFNVTVTARDVYWNTCIDYTGSIRFKSSDDSKVSFPAGLQSMAGSNGVKIYSSGVLINAIGAYWLRAADAVFAFKSGDQQNILIGPGAYSPSAGESTLTVDQTTKVAGEFVYVTITPKDAQGNLLYACRNISVFLDGVTSDYNGPIIVHNVGDGSYTASVRVTSTTANNVISAKLDNTSFVQTRTITVTPATAGYLAITGSGAQVAGSSQLITITAYDAFINLATGYTGGKLLTFSGANVTAAPYISPTVAGTAFGTGTTLNFASGIATGSMSLYKVETALVSATDGTISSTGHILSVVVSPIPASYLAVTGTGIQGAGVSQTITVTAYDVYNNVVTAYTGSKTLVFSGANPSPAPVNYPTIAGTAFGTITLTFTAGVSTGSMILYKTETALITATDGSINADNHKLSVLVNPALLKDFLVYGVPSPHDLGTWVSVTVETRDTYNNRKTNYAGTVTFSNTDIAATDPADYHFQLADLGIHTFTNAVTFSAPGNWWLTAMDLNEPAKYGYQANIIVKRPIIITANIQSKTYGTALSLGTTGFTVTGTLAPEETITNVDLASSGTTASANIGIYDISTSNATSTGTFTAANYDITYSSTGKLTVNQALVTVTAQTDTKVYNGTNSSTVAPVVTGIISPDAIGTTPTQSFDNRNTGTGKTLTAIGLVISDGNNGNNYAVSYVANTTGVINTAAVTVTAQTDTKVYNGTSSSSVAPVVTGIITPDAIGTAPTQSFDNRNTGTGKTFTAIGLAISDGNSGNNYTVSYLTNITGTITAAPVTVTAQTDTKVYDGTTGSLVLPVVGTLQTGDAVTLAGIETFDNKNAGTSKVLTPTGTVINDGNGGANYAISYVTDLTGVITTAPLTVTTQTDTKTYDGTTSSLVLPVVGTLQTGDAVTLAGIETFDNKNAGTSKVLTPSGTVINDGIGGADYSVTYVTDATGVITTAPLNVTAITDIKVYDGTTGSSVLPVVGTLQTGDAVTLAGILAFDTRNIGTEKVLTPSGTVINDGNGGANYTVNFVTDATGVINTAPLTITADNQAKTYGTANPLLTISYSGFVNGENSTVIVLPSISTTALTGSDGGTYPITVSGGSDSCYSFIYRAGTMTISQISQIITFTDIPANMFVKDVYTIAASSTSGLTVLFESVNPQFATVTGNQLDGVSRGTARIRAYNPGDQNYLPAEIFADVEIISTHKDILHLFTPNNDGFNDTWEIPYIQSYGECDVKVYNRWGQMVYANKNYNNLWDGSSNGNPLPDGAYYFIIKTENSGTISGTVNIVR